nr:MAG TPA: hypothetical protein [Caudoviricetes sp.]
MALPKAPVATFVQPSGITIDSFTVVFLKASLLSSTAPNIPSSFSDSNDPPLNIVPMGLKQYLNTVLIPSGLSFQKQIYRILTSLDFSQ